MRVAVLGLGGVGTAAARFLAEAGHTVFGFEQYRLDHDRGSSYGESRIIRRVYPDSLYARLMEAAYPLWADLEQASGEELLVRCGGLFFGPEGHAEMTATEAALQQVGVPYQRWSATEAALRLLPFRLAAGEYGIFEPDSGFLRASRCVLANARGARAAGAELREGARVEALETAAEGVRLRVGGETVTVDRVVIAGGPWSARILDEWVSLPLRVTRQQYAHFAVEGGGAAFSPERFPVWIDMAELYYGFPCHRGGEAEVKVAWHRPGPEFDPDVPDRIPQEAENERLRAYLRRRLPDAAGPVTYSKVCLYTMTPDEDFIVDRMPGEERVVCVAGLSGHGFKFTVLLGQIAARLALGREPGQPLERFRLSRFETSPP